MAKDLKDVEAEYVIFAAYLQKDSEQENWEVNGKSSHRSRPKGRMLTLTTTSQEQCLRTSSPH